jgi:hypothetical protein
MTLEIEGDNHAMPAAGPFDFVDIEGQSGKTRKTVASWLRRFGSRKITSVPAAMLPRASP